MFCLSLFVKALFVIVCLCLVCHCWVHFWHFDWPSFLAFITVSGQQCNTGPQPEKIAGNFGNFEKSCHRQHLQRRSFTGTILGKGCKIRFCQLMPFPQTSRQNFWGKKSESDMPLQTRPGSFVGEFARIVIFAIIIAILFLMMMMISEQGGRWDFVRSVYLDEVSSANSPPSHQSAILILTITTSTSASLSILIRKTWSSPPEEKVGEMEVDSPSQGITFTSLILPFHPPSPPSSSTISIISFTIKTIIQSAHSSLLTDTTEVKVVRDVKHELHFWEGHILEPRLPKMMMSVWDFKVLWLG